MLIMLAANYATRDHFDESTLSLDFNSLRTIVQNFVKTMKIVTPFRNGMPGFDWIYW